MSDDRKQLARIQPLTMQEKQKMQIDTKRDDLKAALADADMLEMVDMPAQIKRAVADVAAAKTMLAESQAKLAALRKKAEALLWRCARRWCDGADNPGDG